MRSACNGTYRRHDDGWRYPWGNPVPGAEDMTISSLYNLPVYGAGHGRWVAVPPTLARNEPELAWCLDHPAADEEMIARWRQRTPGDLEVGTLMVPLDEWDGHAREPIGMWAPELHPDRLLGSSQVAEMAGVSPDTLRTYVSRGSLPAPQGWHSGSPWWTRPVIARWLADRPQVGHQATGVWWKRDAS